jgi:hypothetical protein
VVSISIYETIQVWDLKSGKEALAPPTWRWRPWISSAELFPGRGEIIAGRTDKAFGPVDAESNIFLSIILHDINTVLNTRSSLSLLMGG